MKIAISLLHLLYDLFKKHLLTFLLVYVTVINIAEFSQNDIFHLRSLDRYYMVTLKKKIISKMQTVIQMVYKHAEQ